MKKLLQALSCFVALTVSSIALADGHGSKIEDIHFLIPGGAGGGWDGTARGVGEALTESGLVGKATFENMSGGGGGKAIAYLIENANSNKDTLMVNSTPIILRSLTGVFPQSFRDLTLVAGVIGDYAAIVVKKDSPIQSFADLVVKYEENPAALAIAGGSVAGSMDHLVAALAFKSAGANPTQVTYLPFDAGGKAMASLLSGEADALSTGYSEAKEMQRAGEIRILITTAPGVVDGIPSLKTEGYDAEFINWRGFFAAPGVSDEKVAMYVETFEKMYSTDEWAQVRDRNGWVDVFNSSSDFEDFLVNQEGEMETLMKELGFL